MKQIISILFLSFLSPSSCKNQSEKSQQETSAKDATIDTGLALWDGAVLQCEQGGFKVYTDQIVSGGSSHEFRLPRGAKTIGFEIDKEHSKLREQGADCAIVISGSHGIRMAATIGATDSREEGFDEVSFTIENVSALDRRVLIFWK